MKSEHLPANVHKRNGGRAGALVTILGDTAKRAGVRLRVKIEAEPATTTGLTTVGH
jgi:hypothetical protein